MTQVKTRKQRVMFTVEQKLDYVKLMINEGYTNKQINGKDRLTEKTNEKSKI